MMPVLPYFATETLKMKESQFGWMISLYGLGQIFGNYYTCKLSDTLGRRPMVLFSFAWTTCGVILTSMSFSPMTLIGARFLHGIGSSTLGKCQVVVADLTNIKDRARYMSYIGVLIACAYLLGPFLASIVIGQLNVSRAWYIRMCSAVHCVALVVGVLKFLESLHTHTHKLDKKNSVINMTTTQEKTRPTQEESTPTQEKNTHAQAEITHTQDGCMMGMSASTVCVMYSCLVYFMSNSSLVMMQSAYPIHFKYITKLNPDVFLSVMLGVMGLGSTLSQAFVPHVIQLMGLHYSLNLGLVLMGVGAVVTFISMHTALWIHCVCVCVLGWSGT
eukprot:GHVR01005119.1.p1 GENE.GHVR01005119.1~~GHVR01005119.1.p1  ORF type:complete len:331 (-),score=73.97 GHVR01005119.1:319-1311(-)